MPPVAVQQRVAEFKKTTEGAASNALDAVPTYEFLDDVLLVTGPNGAVDKLKLSLSDILEGVQPAKFQSCLIGVDDSEPAVRVANIDLLFKER